MDLLEPIEKRTFCEWKGVAPTSTSSWTGSARRRRPGRTPSRWRPSPSCATAWPSIPSGWTAAPGRTTRSSPTAGDFYGGWITQRHGGPVQGRPRHGELVSPLRFEDGALLVLDQRLLPAREEWLRCESPAEVAAGDRRRLAVRGAPAIGLAAAYGLALALDEGERCGEEARVNGVGGGPAAARGAAHGVEPGAGRSSGARPRSRPPTPRAVTAGEALLESAQRARGATLEIDHALAVLGAERFEAGDRALTHCNTGPLATARLRHRRWACCARPGRRSGEPRVGGRDAPAAAGRAADRLGAPGLRHPATRWWPTPRPAR